MTRISFIDGIRGGPFRAFGGAARPFPPTQTVSHSRTRAAPILADTLRPEPAAASPG